MGRDIQRRPPRTLIMIVQGEIMRARTRVVAVMSLLDSWAECRHARMNERGVTFLSLPPSHSSSCPLGVRVTSGGRLPFGPLYPGTTSPWGAL